MTRREGIINPCIDEGPPEARARPFQGLPGRRCDGRRAEDRLTDPAAGRDELAVARGERAGTRACWNRATWGRPFSTRPSASGRSIYERAPPGGLPELPGCRELRGGEIIGAKRLLRGFNDAPVELRRERGGGNKGRGAKLGGSRSTLYLRRGKNGLDGSSGDRADDDPMNFSDAAGAECATGLGARSPRDKWPPKEFAHAGV